MSNYRDDTKHITVYVTKYALGQGIITEQVKVCEGHAGMVRAVEGGAHYYKDEWFLTLDEAKKNAEERRIAKSASLREHTQKLEKLTF
jgi:hypothetical protein